MNTTTRNRTAISTLLASLFALATATSAVAGECPAGKAGTNALANAPTAPVGVTDTELAAIDLAKENVKLNQRRLRLRHMTIAPGGIEPLWPGRGPRVRTRRSRSRGKRSHSARMR